MWDQTAANFSKSCLIVVPNLPDVQFAEAQREKWCRKNMGAPRKKLLSPLFRSTVFSPLLFNWLNAWKKLDNLDEGQGWWKESRACQYPSKQLV